MKLKYTYNIFLLMVPIRLTAAFMPYFDPEGCDF